MSSQRFKARIQVLVGQRAHDCSSLRRWGLSEAVWQSQSRALTATISIWGSARTARIARDGRQESAIIRAREVGDDEVWRTRA